jgi:hypothetical protein
MLLAACSCAAYTSSGQQGPRVAERHRLLARDGRGGRGEREQGEAHGHEGRSHHGGGSLRSSLRRARGECLTFPTRRREESGDPIRNTRTHVRHRPLPPAWLDALNAEQRAAADARGRPAADPRRRGHRQDDDARGARGRAAGRGVPPERDPAADVHAPGRARDAGPRDACARVPAAAGRVVGGTFHAVGCVARARHAAALGLPRRFGGARRRATPPTCSTCVREEDGLARRPAVPAQARRCSTSTRARSTPSAAVRGLPSAFPWCEDALDGLARCSAPTPPASARSGCSTSTTCCCTGAALARHPTVGPRLAARFDHVLVDEYQDVNGLQATSSTRSCATRRAHRRGRRPAGDLRLPRGDAPATSSPSAGHFRTRRS